MRCLITGVSGFIGRSVSETLFSKGHDSIGLDRHPKPVTGVVLNKRGDTLDRELVFEMVSGVDGVVNLAGVLGTSELLDSVHDAVRGNIEAAVNVYDACLKHDKPLVQIATGNKSWASVYPITKECAVALLQVYVKDLGLKAVVVRAMNAYGPHQKTAPIRKFVPNAIRWAIRGEPIRIYGSGNQVMDPVWVGDVAEIISRALTTEHGSWGQIFEAGSGHGISVNEMARMIWSTVRDDEPQLEHEPMRPGEPEMSRVVADLSTLKPLGKMGFLPLETGLEKTVNWYKSRPEVFG